MTQHIFKSKDSKVTVSLDRSLLGDSDPGIWRRIAQWVKGMIGAILLLLILWVICGTPYLRWDEPLVDGKDGTDLREEDLAFTRYISIGDIRRVHAGEYGKGLPWLIFIPRENEDSDETPPPPTTHPANVSF